MWVKICGITNPKDAEIAISAGADALGFVFEPRSPRHLPNFPNWQEWVPKLKTTRVLVLADWNHLPAGWELFDRVQYTVPTETLILGGVWNGEWGVREPEKGLKTLPPPHSPFPILHSPPRPLWLAFRFPPEWNAERALRAVEPWLGYAERILLDAYHPDLPGGTGETHDWARARWLCERLSLPVVLAGGLNPENVESAIRTVQPWGVDVSSGVEAQPGKKDPDRVRLFIQRARGALR